MPIAVIAIVTRRDIESSTYSRARSVVLSSAPDPAS